MKTNANTQRLLRYAVSAAVSAAALYIRFLGRDVISADFKNCLNSWYLEVTTPGPGIESLLSYTGDYPMPYAFMIWLLGKLPFPFLYSLKTVNVIFDFALAALAGKIVEHFRPERPDSFFWGYCVTLLLPNVVLNGGFWGQCDGTYSAFLLAAFYCWLRKKYPAMMLWFGLAFSFKLQAVFFLPFVLIVYWLEREFSLLHFLIIPATMLVMNIPAVIAGYSPMITFTKYMGQAGGYPWLYYFYPNLWFFFQARPYYLFSTGAVMLAMSALLFFVVLLVKKNVLPTRRNTLHLLLWSAYTCAFFLPSMHERYGYFMELVAVILAIVDIRTVWVAVVMILCTFPKYLYAVGYVGNPLSLQMAEAAVNTALYMAYTCVLWRRLFPREGSTDSDFAVQKIGAGDTL